MMIRKRFLIMLFGIALALVSGYQAIVIAQVGVVNQIPQLEGDGGGGVVSAGLCLAGALLFLLWPSIAAFLFGLSAVVGAITGLVYHDAMMCLWSIASMVFALIPVIPRWVRKRNPSQTAKKRLQGKRHAV